MSSYVPLIRECVPNPCSPSGVLNYLGPKDLTVYYIKETSFDSFDLPDGSRTVQVQIRLGRRLLGVALTTYLPTVLILIIVHLTHYYKSFYFEAIVTVCLTCEYKFDQARRRRYESLRSRTYLSHD